MAVRSIEQTQRQRIYAAKPWLKDADTEFVRLFVFPDRIWQWFDGGSSVFGLSLNVYNLALSVHYLAFPGEVRKLSASARDGYQLWEAQLIYLNDSKWLHPKPMRLIHDKNVPRGEDAIQTELEGERYRADFYLDKHTHLPVSIIVYVRNHIVGLPEVSEERYELSKYRETDGVLMPDRVTQTVALHSFVWDYDVHLNVEFQERAFTTPPSLGAGPYAWRRPRETK